jgi:hypothetical protein
MSCIYFLIADSDCSLFADLLGSFEDRMAFLHSLFPAVCREACFANRSQCICCQQVDNISVAGKQQTAGKGGTAC